MNFLYGGGHLSLTSYEEHSSKQSTPVTNAFSTLRGCPLTIIDILDWEHSLSARSR